MSECIEVKRMMFIYKICLKTLIISHYIKVKENCLFTYKICSKTDYEPLHRSEWERFVHLQDLFKNSDS